MLILHGLLCWLTAHCWSCRLGASWRLRRDPSATGHVFLSAAFLRFAVGVCLLEIPAAVAVYASGGFNAVATIGLGALVAGLVTGVAHGGAEY